MNTPISPELAHIKPFEHVDQETGDKISISISPFYFKLIINKREYFFIRETGEFDGVATIVRPGGPILIYDGE
jgi:hypothetical protein